MNFYVTTSIPYVNGEPHLGHAMEFIMADVLARHARAQGKPTLLSIGTDEHGGKIAEKAEEQGISPKEFADKISAQFRDLAKELNVSNDRFIRTTDESHERISQIVWSSLADDIYKGSYSGWYCTGDEAFFTEAVVKANNGICPAHNRPYEKVEEENYFFKLSKYEKPILEAVESEKFRIIPATKKNEILQVIRDGLDDISISRPKDKITWGIDVPGDDSQVMYVWFEALLNYISVLNFPDGADFKEFWPANYQVIGKDILRFHAAIWPAILMSLKQPLPDNLYVHGFINIDGHKMSKSLGKVISPSEIIEKYSADSFRYFFLRHVPSYNDGDFSWEKFHEAYQNELANELGNGVQRTAVMVKNYLNGAIGEITEDHETKTRVSKLIEECHFDRALDEIWLRVKALNQYIDDEKPWVLSKEGNHDKLTIVLNKQVSDLVNIGKLLVPFLPETAQKIVDIFKPTGLNLPETTLFPKKELLEA